MKTAITILIITMAVLYIGKTSIQFSPFKISMAKPFDAIGFVLLAAAIGCFSHQAYTNGRKSILNEEIQQLKKELNENG